MGSRGIISVQNRGTPESPAGGLVELDSVARGDETLLAKGYGYADLESRVPASPETVYDVGSVSKVFTATSRT